MARPLRLEHAGAIWHVTSRGNARQPIVHDDVDRARFVEMLGRVVPTVRWCLHAWVLMTNHYHLLIETPEPTLARGMRQLNGVFSHRKWGQVSDQEVDGASHSLGLFRGQRRPRRWGNEIRPSAAWFATPKAAALARAEDRLQSPS